MKEKIIKIDDKSRIEIDNNNYKLQYYYKGETKNPEKVAKFQWHTDGYFPNMVSLATEYLNNAPRASSEATGDIKKLIKVIEGAEKRIKAILTN